MAETEVANYQQSQCFYSVGRTQCVNAYVSPCVLFFLNEEPFCTSKKFLKVGFVKLWLYLSVVFVEGGVIFVFYYS